MNLNIWWNWFRNKPIQMRWFILFLLIRPIAEQFYNLKQVSPLLSPLYWIGALTLIFSVIAIANAKWKYTGLDNTFLIWSFLVIISVFFLFFSFPNLVEYLNFSIKLILPVVVYFFLRVFIRDKSDFTGLITTILLSCIFPLVTLLAGLSNSEGLTESRLQGLYPDVFNNAFYLSTGMMALLYHYILRNYYSGTLKIGNLALAAGIIVSILGLWAIKHLATIAVFISMMIIFIYIVFRRKFSSALLMIIMIVLFVTFAGDRFYKEVINPRIEGEVEVISGEREETQGVHGRVSRWTWLMTDFNSAPILSKMAGYPLTLKHSRHLIGITPHNDFLRIMFFTGYLGLALYLLILFRVFRRIRYKDVPDKFIMYSILTATILYSITTVPTFYPGYINIMMIVFAYCSVPSAKPNR